jgi:type I restriction enzyme, S subunit
VRFIKYKLETIKQHYQQVSQGAAQDNLSLEKLLSFKLKMPKKPEQVAIADILTAYDDLMENNRRRMALLEESARLLYREWFVHLRFPGHEKAKLTNGVPKGWERVPLGAVSSKIGSGATPRGGDSAYQTEGIPLIRSMNVYDDRFDDDGLAFINEEQAAALANVTVQSRDILLNITGASVCRCCMAPERYVPARVNQHVMIIRTDPTKADPFFVHAAINSDERKRQLLSYAQKGSTREALTKETVSNFEITLPTEALMLQFGEIAGDAFRQRETLAQQTQKLRTARDMVLPRLMSGEISV